MKHYTNMEWIKFSEQKPKKRKNYLIAIKYADLSAVSYYDVASWNGKHFTFWNSYDDCESKYNDNEIQAWMEIPKCEI